MKYFKTVRLWSLILMILGVLVYMPYIVDATIATTTQVKATNNMTLLYWTIAIIGGLIAVTLTYVSWRKYKGEEKKRKNNDPNS